LEWYTLFKNIHLTITKLIFKKKKSNIYGFPKFDNWRNVGGAKRNASE